MVEKGATATVSVAMSMIETAMAAMKVVSERDSHNRIGDLEAKKESLVLSGVDLTQ